MDKKVLSITPGLASFATPYSSGDVLGAVNTVSSAALNSGQCDKLDTVLVLDKANQKAALDLIFFSEAPANSLGADNAAYALNDADLATVIGRVSVAAADYVSSSTTNAEATLRNIELTLQPKPGTQTIFMVAVARGAATYGSASDLIIKLGLEQD